MLSCGCGEFDPDAHEWAWYQPQDFCIFEERRRKRCSSCKDLIEQKATVVRFDRFRGPKSEIEERCKGDEIELAPYFLCEKCGEIFFNLSEAGYCLDIEKSMEDYMQEYREIG